MTHLKLIFDILALDDWYNVKDDDLQIAKGRYKSPTNLKELRDRIKRR